MIELRLRSRLAKPEMDAKVGKILGDADVSALLTHDARMLKPDGSLLCIYRRGAIPEAIREGTYPTLTTIRAETTNRGLASGSQRVRVRPGSKNSYARPVPSSVVGAIEGRDSRHPICRLTAWTGEHWDQYQGLFPLFKEIARQFAANVPERYANQAAEAARTQPDWVIKGTPFTTITVNNTYATGVHKDAGDLPEGFSCLAVLRRGQYTGGWLCFPEYRLGVDMQDGDLILMDAHEFHGNTEIIKRSEDAERISTVCYFRSNMVGCGSSSDELARGKARATLGLGGG